MAANIEPSEIEKDKLRLSERRLHKIIENNVDGIVIVDSDGIVLFMNPAASSLFDRNPHEFMGKPFGFPVEANVTMEISIVRKGRERAIAEMRAGEIDWEGKSAHLLSLRDISERKRAEEALRESEERYRRITGAVTDYVFTVRIEDGHPVETVHGPACVAVTGYTPEDFASDPHLWIRMVHEEDRAAVQEQARRVLLGQDVPPVEHRILRKDGVMRWVMNTLVPHYGPQGNLLSYDGLIRDIHERKEAKEAKAKLEAQLQQAQKMEAIGTLAGGIAHDFNNILFAMFGFTELANDDVPEESLARANLDEVLKAGRRAKDLVQQILTFSRQGEQERKALKIQLIVKEVLKLLRASLPSTIEITQNIDKDCGPVLADPSHIHQIIMNLCTNAYHAMRENGGRLEVTLSEVGIDSEDQVSNPGLKPGPYLRLTVGDTGCGMPSEVIQRIFEPYFTTKETGEGTGLGLAVVHGIVKKYCGHIHVYSEPGKGATFHVYLPRTRSGDVAPETASTVPVPKGNERILLVDDEEQIVRMMTETLEHLGYRVTARTSSVEALEVFSTQPERFDLVITDLTMPNLTGTQLARKLTGISPGVPIILCTGFSETITPEKAKIIGIREFVMKPVARDQMAKIVRKVLDEKGRQLHHILTKV